MIGSIVIDKSNNDFYIVMLTCNDTIIMHRIKFKDPTEDSYEAILYITRDNKNIQYTELINGHNYVIVLMCWDMMGIRKLLEAKYRLATVRITIEFIDHSHFKKLFIAE